LGYGQLPWKYEVKEVGCTYEGVLSRANITCLLDFSLQMEKSAMQILVVGIRSVH